MGNYLVMITLCLGVVGAMALVLVTFFRKLKRIEEERWGKNSRWAPGITTGSGKAEK